MSKGQMIYQYIRENGSVSKQDIVLDLQYSLPTITLNLSHLEEMNLIDTSKKIENTGGRNATAYTYLPQARGAIGIYLTEHHMNCVAIDLSGKVILDKKKRKVFHIKNDEYLREIGKTIEEIKEEAGISNDQLLGVGIALPGLISEDGKTVIYGRTLDFTGAVCEEIAKYIPYKTRLFHDSSVAGYAEVWENNEIQNAFYISLANSVGGAFISNGAVYKGNMQRGGEIGHMVLKPEMGKPCYCGNRGCFDTVCSTACLVQHTDGNLEAFFEQLESGDKSAKDLWNRYLENLAIGIHNIRMLFDSDIIIGGYVGAFIEKYMEDLCKKVDKRKVFCEDAKTYLYPCKYKVEAAAAGAAIWYIDEFFSSI